MKKTCTRCRTPKPATTKYFSERKYYGRGLRQKARCGLKSQCLRRAAEYINKHNASQTCVVLPFRKKEG